MKTVSIAPVDSRIEIDAELVGCILNAKCHIQTKCCVNDKVSVYLNVNKFQCLTICLKTTEKCYCKMFYTKLALFKLTIVFHFVFCRFVACGEYVIGCVFLFFYIHTYKMDNFWMYKYEQIIGKYTFYN